MAATDMSSENAPPGDDAATGHAVAGIGLGDILRRPLPGMPQAGARAGLRFVTLLARRQVRTIHGLENIAPGRDPFLLALSHNIRREAVLVPGLMMFLRNGHRIHFLADWNFMLIPGVGWIMRQAQVITVTRKPTIWPLDYLRPLFRGDRTPADTARDHLLAGRSVGVFPEGTVNPDPNRMLPGRVGMARLSIETGAPVVPAGIRFPDAPRDRPLSESSVMDVHIGRAMTPPPPAGATPTLAEAQGWHNEVMAEIARLSGKTWTPRKRTARPDAPAPSSL